MEQKETGCTGGITVYGASSDRIDSCYTDAARTLGRLIAEAGRPLVCGGGRKGIMGAAIEGAIAAGGEAVGVIPQFMVDRSWHNPALSRMIVTDGMHPRKRTMAQLSVAAIACPGGIGTFEELTEIITWRELGLWHGNIVILNTRDYYGPLLEMLDKASRLNFMRSPAGTLWSVASTPEEAVRLALRPLEPAGGFKPKS